MQSISRRMRPNHLGRIILREFYGGPHPMPRPHRVPDPASVRTPQTSGAAAMVARREAVALSPAAE